AVGFVAGEKTIAQRDVGAATDRDEAAVRMTELGLFDDVMRETIDGRVRSVDGNIPGPIVIALLLLHAVGNRCKHTAFDEQRALVDRVGVDLGDRFIIPIDRALDRTVAAQDEAIALRGAVVLVETAANIDAL